jgi:serine O-acetyltransferase
MGEFVHYCSRIFYVFLVTILRHDIRCKIPKNTIFTHGALNVVISKPVKLGDCCHIGHNVTLGERNGKCPTIEDHVVVCSHSIVLGDITIGHHSIIGAGSVVLNSFEPYSVIAGNPAKIIRKRGEHEVFR